MIVRNFQGIRLMVVAVGVDNMFGAVDEMKSWASSISGEQMAISVSDHDALAQLAYAIHRGSEFFFLFGFSPPMK